MKLYCIAVLVAFSLFSPSFCLPAPDPFKLDINNKSAELIDATTLAANSKEQVDNVTTPQDKTESSTDGGVTIPEIPTILPETTTPSTTTKQPTSKPTIPTTPTSKTSSATTPTTTSTTPPTPSSKTTEGPKSTESPTAATTSSPHSKGRQFDGPSFIGGIVLASGLTAIGFVAFKFYKARTERNYHTL